MTKAQPVRITVTPKHNQSVRVRFPSHDLLFNQPLKLKNKRLRARNIRGVARDQDGILYVMTFFSRGKTEFYEHDVDADQWALLFSEENKRLLKPKPKPRKFKAYNVGNYYSSHPKVDNRHILRKQKGKYTVGCQTINRAHLIKLCKAILEDEGELH